MKKIYLHITIAAISLFLILWAFYSIKALPGYEETVAATAAIVGSPYVYSFNVPGVLFETGGPSNSTSRFWWVNSGAMMAISSSTGRTVHGSLPTNNYWRKLYAITNSKDTDNGYHPQNIFRLISRSTWQNSRQTMYFKIDADQLSNSSNRNASNGLLLLNNYQDGNNLYYAGIRVDGTAVIKKKVKGTYYTMAYKKIFPGTYDSKLSPNLLPHNTWIGLRSEFVSTSTTSMTIKLYSDVGRTGKWKLIAEATDNGKSYGGAPIIRPGFTGIRTDFMDVSMTAYRVEKIR